MQTHPKKLLVIIAEAALERAVVRDARRLGALGYTVSDVRGGGGSSEREAEWEGSRVVRIELVCAPEVAEAIARHVFETYLPNYSVTLFLADCAVFRAEKF